jgi:uncharacterized protein (TIGR00297 family)
MVGYPAVVLVLILLGWASAFPQTAGCLPVDPASHMAAHARWGLAVAASAWAVLAFGDASAALCGILLKGPALPWNPRKTWTGLIGFLAAASASSLGVLHFVARDPALFLGRGAEVAALCLLASLAAALVESLPGQFDDNLTVPLAAWAVLSFVPGGAPLLSGASAIGRAFASGSAGPERFALAALLLLHFGLALSAWMLKWVDLRGFLIGAGAGLSVALALGWRGYALLLLFYAAANTSTMYGRRTKEGRGIAEAHGGQRRTPSVFSKGFAPALYAWLSPLAFAAALAVYAADTVASEFGKTARGRTLLLLSRRWVPPGAPGALSLKGTIWGVATLLIMAAAFGALLGREDLPGQAAFVPSWMVRTGGAFPALTVLGASLLWFLLESVINEWNGRRDFLSKVVIHVMVGLMAGATTELPRAIAGLIWGPAPFGSVP